MKARSVSPAARRAVAAIAFAAWFPMLLADESRHDMTESAGPQAGHIEWLWWLMTGVCTAVFVLVMLALATALARRRDPTPEKEDLPPASARRISTTISAALVATVAILGVFLVAAVYTDQRLRDIEGGEGSVTIKVTGRQWWWDLEYEHPEAHKRFVAANEIHIPVGRPVHLKLATADVIHSLWIPSLHGKMDMIPGRENQLWIQADRPGVFEGQCAEFCGHQHAHMRLVVVAEPLEKFEAWREGQLKTAQAPQTPAQRRGQDLFMRTTCVMCHAVRGTLAGSNNGPDLTHFGSRTTLAAASRANTRDNLLAWIRNPQELKPGTQMPGNEFSDEDLQALADYLENLK